MTSCQYRKSHCGDKTIWRPSYLHNGISYTGKMTSLYWIRALAPCIAKSSTAMMVLTTVWGPLFPLSWSLVSFLQVLGFLPPLCIPSVIRQACTLSMNQAPQTVHTLWLPSGQHTLHKAHCLIISVKLRNYLLFHINHLYFDSDLPA